MPHDAAGTVAVHEPHALHINCSSQPTSGCALVATSTSAAAATAQLTAAAWCRAAAAVLTALCAGQLATEHSLLQNCAPAQPEQPEQRRSSTDGMPQPEHGQGARFAVSFWTCWRIARTSAWLLGMRPCTGLSGWAGGVAVSGVGSLGCERCRRVHGSIVTLWHGCAAVLHGSQAGPDRAGGMCRQPNAGNQS